MVTLEEVLIQGSTERAVWEMEVREAKRKMAEGTEPRKREAPERKRLPIEARRKLKPCAKSQTAGDGRGTRDGLVKESWLKRKGMTHPLSLL
jgi:hypothetical protein